MNIIGLTTQDGSNRIGLFFSVAYFFSSSSSSIARY